MKVIIEVDQKDLRVITVPEQYKNFEIQNFGYAGVYLMETDSTSLNHWKMYLGKDVRYEILGFAKDVIIGEQMKGGNFLLLIK